jgi:SAM-dependent methyltransferase
MSTTTQGSAHAQAALWGRRAQDWADVVEGRTVILYDTVFDELGVGAGTRLLDAGCGTGFAARRATERGATVTGLDATPEFIAIAAERQPGGDYTVGELEALPYEDDSFDAVTGFNSFQFAAQPVNALREARRVARPGAPVAITTWGAPEHCEMSAYFAALRELMPPPPPGAPGPFALSTPGALEAFVGQAGLTARTELNVPITFEYPDQETLLRGLLSPAPAIKAADESGEAAVSAAILRALHPFRTSTGGYVLENEFRYLVAEA